MSNPRVIRGKGLFVLQFRLILLVALSLVIPMSRDAFAQLVPVASTQPELPVEVEARQSTPATSDKVHYGALPMNSGSDAAKAALPTDNSGSITVAPPLKALTTAPVLGAAFEGIPDTGSAPANPNIAVGPNKILQVVSGGLRVIDRFAVNPDTTISLNAVFGVPAGSTGLLDPLCVYDHFADRFAVLCSARNVAGTDGWYVLAVTKSPFPMADPATWSVYYIRNDTVMPNNTDTATYGDYARLGFDNTSFYITSNQYNSANVFQYAKIRVYRKSEVYGKKPLSVLEFNDVRDATGARAFGIQPAITFGTPGTEYFVSCPPATGNAITVYSFVGGVLPRITLRSIPANSWTTPLPAYQKVTGPRVETGDARLQGAVFRNNRLYTVHAVRRGTFPCAAHYIGVNTTNLTKSLDLTIGSPSVYYYYPALTVTPGGNIGTVFNFSSLTRFPGIMYTQIVPTGTGTILTPAVLREGQGNYFRTNPVNGLAVWGRYSGIAIDPSSPDRIWFNAAYTTSSPFSWGTYVGSTSLFGGLQTNTVQDAGVAVRDQLLDWAKTTPVFGPTLP